MAQKLDRFKTDYKLLIESGFVAINQGDEDSATKLFKAAEALRPDDEAWQMGAAYINLSKMDLQKAAAGYASIFQKNPSNRLAQAFLGLTLGLTYAMAERSKKPVTDPHLKEKAQELLQEAGDKSEDPIVKNLAKTSLEWLKSGLKAASPLEKSVR